MKITTKSGAHIEVPDEDIISVQSLGQTAVVEIRASKAKATRELEKMWFESGESETPDRQDA